MLKCDSNEIFYNGKAKAAVKNCVKLRMPNFQIKVLINFKNSEIKNKPKEVITRNFSRSS